MIQSLNNLESLGRYKLLSEIGRGGMSVVYLAHDTELGREVAVKCVSTQDKSTAKLATQLRAEAKLLAQLNHPNIVQLYDVVEQNNVLGLVIEFIGGDTLTQRLRQSPTKEIKLKWLAEIAEGLSSAHQKGIAHCDLKTDNILITHNNIAKVADFGIAKVKLDGYLGEDGLTQKASINGSYLSLSPEQATGQAVDTRTDLFSFAILIHQTLCSEHPFGDTRDKATLLQQIISKPPQISTNTLDSLGPRLTGLLKDLLNKDPNDRVYNASEIAELLRSEQVRHTIDNRESDTVEIPTQKALPQNNKALRFNWQGIGGKLALLSAGFIVGIALLKLPIFTTPSAAEVSYIALDKINITASEDFNKALLPLIKSTLQQSVESSLLSFEQTGLVEAKELNSAEGSYARKALISGVDDIVIVSANCLQQKCDIKLQRRSGERMAVSQQNSFPIASTSLIELKNAVSTQLPTLFNRTSLAFRPSSSELNEENYRRYLEIYTESNSGVSSDPKHFSQIQQLINDSPNFIPSYTLLYRLGSYLHSNTGQKKHLLSVLSVLQNTPNRISEDIAIKRAKINALVDLERVPEARSVYLRLKEEISDELLLSEIESRLAYADDDYEKLLQLDRQNAIWRPSVDNLYNLATSEFFFGNHDKAHKAVERVLSLSPGDTYALDLKAGIEMNKGNLSTAITIYQGLLDKNQDSNIYSNLGIALMLDQQYSKAIDSHQNAVEIKPDSSLHHLNLGDAYTLAGKHELAKNEYQTVLSLLQSPKSAQEYSSLAQAQAHLKQYNLAVKTLKVSNKKFPNIAELDYAASIVNTLAGNYISAVVDVNDAIDRGTAPVWFSFKWFKPLCPFDDFKASTGAAVKMLCG